MDKLENDKCAGSDPAISQNTIDTLNSNMASGSGNSEEVAEGKSITKIEVKKKKKIRRKGRHKRGTNILNTEENGSIECLVEGIASLEPSSTVYDEVESLIIYNGVVRDKMTCKNSRVRMLHSEPVSVVLTQESIPNASLENEELKKKKRNVKKHTKSLQNTPTHSPSTDGKKHKHTLKTQESKTLNKEISTHDGKKKLRTSVTKYTFDKYLTANEVHEGLKSEVFIEGTIRINQKNYKEAYISSPDKGQDIMIDGMKNRNRALEGDTVVIKLNPETEWKVQGSNKQKTGVVVYISKKVHPRTAVGYLKPLGDGNTDYAIFSPRDSRIPRIRIKKDKCPEDFAENIEKYSKILYLACIKDWSSVHFANGELQKAVGVCGDIKGETTAILLENDIDSSPYDETLYKFFPCAPFKIPEEEFNNRIDLRNECIFTIDPLTAKDLDDAMSCQKLENGNFKIGVHISDVTYFLKEDTPLDSEVSMRATSTYLVDAVHHMLPKEMCLLCSLLPGEDKLAFSVFWEMTPQAEIVSHYFTRSVINSCTQLAYEHAQIMLENPDKEWEKEELPQINGPYSPKDLSQIVNYLNNLAIILRNKRFNDGALRIDLPKLMFSLDYGTGLPIKYNIHINKECHRLIEEFMLLANITVATKLDVDFPNIAFLRQHQPPNAYIMNELKKSLEQKGIFLDITSSASLQASLHKYCGDDFMSNARMMVLYNMCTKPMARAKYFCSKNRNKEKGEWHHYALNVPLYTHFTSPIRRYADVIVHRLLSASCGYSDKPSWKTEYVEKIAQTCNRQKYMAKLANEQSIDLFLTVYIGLHGPMVEEAVVMDVKDQSFDIMICSIGMFQRIYTNKLSDPVKVTCKMKEKKVMCQVIEWLPSESILFSTTQIIDIFSIVLVELSRSSTTFKVGCRLLRPSGTGAYST